MGWPLRVGGGGFDTELGLGVCALLGFGYGRLAWVLMDWRYLCMAGGTLRSV